ncbi:MAG TPA: choice-of-anchor Q domain-containing protein, partial [Gemmatimonadaceae bacterium]|nr:choice-of-anchor Q domain-containing protein [Gemmatimonadaceae bacterium]
MRSWLLALASALALLLLPAIAQANTYSVNDTGDSGDGTCDATCTLRDAVLTANANPGDDVVQLAPGTYKLDGQLEIDTGGKVTITSSGTRDNTFIDAQGNDRVLEVLSGANGEVDNVTLRNGLGGEGGAVFVDDTATFTTNNARLSSNEAEDDEGGAIYNDGTVNLNNTLLERNTAPDEYGGGIYNDGGTVNLTDSSITGSYLDDGSGGGIYNDGGTLTLLRSHVDNNFAAYYGAGIYNDGGTLTLTQSTVNDNFGAESDESNGGGIYNDRGALTVTDSAISGNTNYGYGGGIYNNGNMSIDRSAIDHNSAYYPGGGIYNDSAQSDAVTRGGFTFNDVSITNSTISDNLSDDDDGGGIRNDAGTLNLLNDTIAFNQSTYDHDGGGLYADDTVNVKNTILAMNVEDGAVNNCYDSDGYIVDQGHNLENGTDCGFDNSQPGASGDVQNADPLLGPLQNNGGPTFTRAIDNTSPAFDAADDTGCPATDQRGVTRPQFAHCDIGAFELAPAPPPAAPVAPSAPAAPKKIPPTIGVAGVRRACTTSSRVRVRITISKTTAPVKSVKVTLDGHKIKTTTRSRFTLVINAKRLKAGRHRLVITATDTAGNRNVLRR